MMKATEQREQQEEIRFWTKMEEQLGSKVVVTHHAQDRIKGRIGGSKHTIEKIAERAFMYGIGEADVSGQLKRYIEKKRLMKGTANCIKIYHQHAYLFTNTNILITVFRLPNRLLKVEEKTKQKLMQTAS